MKAPGVAGAGSLGTGGRAEGRRVAALAVVERPPLRRAARVRGQYRQFPREASAAGGERDNSRGWMPNEEYAGLPAVLGLDARDDAQALAFRARTTMKRAFRRRAGLSHCRPSHVHNETQMKEGRGITTAAARELKNSDTTDV